MPSKTSSSEAKAGLPPSDEKALPLFNETEAAAEEQAERVAELIEFRNSEDGETLSKWITEQYTSMKRKRERYERQWKVNHAYYARKHGTVVATANGAARSGQLINLNERARNKKKRVNLIRSTIRTEMAKLLSQKPSAYVVPASSEDEDMFAAQAGEQVFLSISDRRELHANYSKSAFWVSITGNGFVKTYWNEGVYDRDSDVMGDVVYEDTTPFNILVPNLREPELEAQPWVLHSYTQTPEWARSFYSAELSGVELGAMHTEAVSILDEAFSDGTDAAKTSVLVHEMWVKPGSHKLLPEGGVAILVNETLVAFHKTYPYDHGKYPWAHIKHIVDGGFYGVSVIEDLIDLQDDYNDIRHHISRTRTVMGKAQFAAQQGSITPSKLTNQTGLVVEYKPGTPPPTVLPVAQLPAYILQDLDRIRQDWEDISGQHQVSKGTAPPGLTAATAISFLQEKDDSYLVPTFQSVERAFANIGRQTLSLAAQYWDVPRLVKVVGTDNFFDAQLFSRSKIANGTDLRIEPGSALPESKAGKQAFMLDLMNMGAVPMDEGLEILEIGGAQKLMDKMKADKRQAQRENVKMKSLSEEDIQQYEQMWSVQMEQSGIPMEDPQSGERLEPPLIVPVNSYDEHQVHIETHNMYRRSQAFELLPDSVKAVFEAHVKQHKLAMQTDMLQQLLSQIPTDGSVPGMQAPEAEEDMGAPAGAQAPPEASEMPSGDAMISEEGEM